MAVLQLDSKIVEIKSVLQKQAESPVEKQIHTDYAIKGKMVYRKIEKELKWLVPKTNRPVVS